MIIIFFFQIQALKCQKAFIVVAKSLKVAIIKKSWNTNK